MTPRESGGAALSVTFIRFLILGLHAAESEAGDEKTELIVTLHPTPTFFTRKRNREVYGRRERGNRTFCEGFFPCQVLLLKVGSCMIYFYIHTLSLIVSGMIYFFTVTYYCKLLATFIFSSTVTHY